MFSARILLATLRSVVYRHHTARNTRVNKTVCVALPEAEFIIPTTTLQKTLVPYCMLAKRLGWIRMATLFLPDKSWCSSGAAGEKSIPAPVQRGRCAGQPGADARMLGSLWTSSCRSSWWIVFAISVWILLLLLLLLSAHTCTHTRSRWLTKWPLATAAEPRKPCYRAGERQQWWCCGAAGGGAAAAAAAGDCSPPGAGTG